MCIYSVPNDETAKHRAIGLAFREQRRCSNEGKTRNPFKYVRHIVGHVQECCLTTLSDCRYMP